MNLVKFSKKNRGSKIAAPLERDAKPQRFSDNRRSQAPRNGHDYIYGLAVIKVSRKYKETPENEYRINPTGWLLPGGRWTDNNGVVMDEARRIDQLIRAAGGLPKGWSNKNEVAA